MFQFEDLIRVLAIVCKKKNVFIFLRENSICWPLQNSGDVLARLSVD